ncbi:hypothetical protein [Nocardioides sp. zg-DK7169]|uniref:hypothetical protein n=1 Tax=Nocardioides sp. zg-DK7169 TaxID=2736600 RepID=UPI001557DBE7|nr:hypothetical protein [Nocardioides sp. zg-DK7169]NPC98508.1 hypothetical protein [Nocardioides sp. zg-DK7169]
MTEPAHLPPETDEAGRSPGEPSAVVVPGIVLVVAGLWMLTDNGPLVVGWACATVGLALLLVGSVAWGVAWGLGLHEHDRRR